MGVAGRPGGADHLVVEPNAGVDAVLGRRRPQIGEDLVRAGDGLLVLPRPELITEGVQIGVRADTGIAEQVPRPSGGAAGLQDRVALSRVFGLQVVGRADARDPGADDEHIDVLDACYERWCGHRCWLLELLVDEVEVTASIVGPTTSTEQG